MPSHSHRQDRRFPSFQSQWRRKDGRPLPEGSPAQYLHEARVVFVFLHISREAAIVIEVLSLYKRYLAYMNLYIADRFSEFSYAIHPKRERKQKKNPNLKRNICPGSASVTVTK